MRSFLLTALVSLCIGSVNSIDAASAYGGFYVGGMYVSFSGTISIPEYGAGPVAITIDANGVLTSSGDLTGTVNDSGAITFNTPNVAGFTTGSIDNLGNLSASASQSANGVTTTWRIETRNSPPGFGAAGTLAGRLTQLNPTKALDNVRSLRYTGRKFIAVGERGGVAFSDDGLTWNPFGLPTTVRLHSIAGSSNGTYVVVGDSGARLYSTNGVDWVSRGSGVNPYTAVAYGNGKFVAVDFLGAITTSPDGNVWTPGTQPVPGGFSGYAKVDFLNGQFVSYGGGKISFSPDAVTWSEPVDTTAGQFQVALFSESKVAFANGVWVAGGDNGVVYSSNGSTWTKVAAPTGRIQMVAAANGKFFVQDTPNDLWVSTDGINYKRVTNTRDLQGVAYGAGRFIALGEKLYTSTDGFYWVLPETDTMRHSYIAQAATVVRPQSFEVALTEEPYYGSGLAGLPESGPIGPAPVRHYAEAANFGRFWVGDNGYIYYHYDTFRTNYGVVPKLTDSTLRASAERFGTGLAFAGDNGAMIRVIQSVGNTPNRFELLPAITSADLLSGADSGTASVFVGSGGTIVATSDSLLRNWAVVKTGGATLRHVRYLSDVTYQSPTNLFVAVGDNGTIFTSPNGTGWTARNSGTTANLIGSSVQVFGSGRRLLVAGSDGTLLASTNGANWSLVTPLPTTQPLARFETNNAFGKYGTRVYEAPFNAASPNDGVFAMTYMGRGSGPAVGAALGNGRWVVVGGNFTAASFDGNQWRSALVPGSFQSIAFGEGRFVAVGEAGFMGYSFDGLNWTFRTNGTKSIFAVAYGNGRFAAVGAGGLTIISEDGITWTDKSSGTEDYYALTHDGSNFVGTGRGGAAIKSSDNGDAWTKSSTFISDSYGIAYGNGLYVIGGPNGNVAWSTNGSKWQSKQLPLPSSAESRPVFRRTVYANGIFYATGNAGELYTTTNGVDWVRLNTGTAERLDVAAVGNGRILLGNRNLYALTIESTGAPFISRQPVSMTALPESSVVLSAEVGGIAPLVLQWTRDGVPIQGATSAALTLQNVKLSDAGEYRLTVGNSVGSVISAPALVAIEAPPEITLQPVSTVVNQGTPVTLKVTALGSGTLSYQWRKNGENITDGSGVFGSTTASLSFPNPVPTNSGNYEVVISNEFGATTSSAAALTVEPPPTPPVIVSQPVGTNVNAGGTIRLRVVAGGGRPLQYAWFKNDAVLTSDARIAGATNDVLTITDARGTDSGTYYVNISNSLGFMQSLRVNVAVIGGVGFRYDYSINVGGPVYDIAPDGQGNYYIAGGFTFFAPFQRNFAKLNGQGLVVSNYQANGANNNILTIAPLAEGSVAVGGSFFQWNGNGAQAWLVRLGATGQVDTTFSSIPSMTVKKAIALPDGKYLIGRTGIGFAASYVTRLNADGTLDNSFTQITQNNRELNDIARQSDGTIWAAGLFGVRKAGPNGTPVTDILPESTWRVFVGPDDRVYLSNGSGNQFTRRKADGSADASFGVTIDGLVHDIAFLSGGRLLIVGSFRTVNGKASSKMAILQSDGALDASFSSPYGGETGDLRAVQDLGDGSVLVGGDVQLTTPNQRNIQRIQIAAAPSNTGQSYDEWKAGSGFSAGANDGPEQDADNDGLSNLAEFALGTNPLSAGSGQRPVARKLSIDSQTYAGIQFTRNKKASGVQIDVSVSNSVVANSNELRVQSVEDLGNDLERVTIRAAQPISQIPKLFFSVKLTRN